MTSQEPVIVCFALTPDEEGYPPVSYEDLWCLPVTEGWFVVDNIPFFARDISLGDEIRVAEEDGKLRFKTMLRASRNSTLHVFVKRRELLDEIRNKIELFGCGVEVMEDIALLAISMPATADATEILEYLDDSDESGVLGFEESAVRYR